MTVSMKTLLEAGVHFGHQTRRWNPKMKPYIFTERNGIYILDLQRTLRELDAAYRFVRELTARGEKVLCVGTKKQAQEPVAAEAVRSGQPYVNQRWLGGMLTNFVTMRTRVSRLEELERMEEDGSMAALPKKEALKLRGEYEKLLRNLAGVREMRELPGALFVIDTKREAIAVAEARRLRIPIIGVVDTNADPDEVDFVVPGNDDAIRSVGLMCRVIADAAAEGRAALEGPEAAEEPAPAAPAPEEPIVEAREPEPSEPAAAAESPETEAAAPEAEQAPAE
ncbi:MAG: 30S ribosomal protein S2 [Coriobacteriia bacterium]|nr:30S ribosomal protein S2 [Coriobacteriia bacterium]